MVMHGPVSANRYERRPAATESVKPVAANTEVASPIEGAPPPLDAEEPPMPKNTPAPEARVRGDTSSNIRCVGSISAASTGEIWHARLPAR